MTFRADHDAQAERIAALEAELAEARGREREHADTRVQLDYVRAKLARAELDRDAGLTPTGRRRRPWFLVVLVALVILTGTICGLQLTARARRLLRLAQCIGASPASEPAAPSGSP